MVDIDTVFSIDITREMGDVASIFNCTCDLPAKPSETLVNVGVTVGGQV